MYLHRTIKHVSIDNKHTQSEMCRIGGTMREILPIIIRQRNLHRPNKNDYIGYYVIALVVCIVFILTLVLSRERPLSRRLVILTILLP